MDRLGGAFVRQAMPMTWDYAETNPLAGAGGDIYGTAYSLREVLDKILPRNMWLRQQDNASTQIDRNGRPPIRHIMTTLVMLIFQISFMCGCAALRGAFSRTFFYRSCSEGWGIGRYALPSRWQRSGKIFARCMSEAMHRLAELSHYGFPATIYCAFKHKQSESDSKDGTASTGWETFLDAVIRAGL